MPVRVRETQDHLALAVRKARVGLALPLVMSNRAVTKAGLQRE
jgi:hypothetical protein